MDSVIAKDGIIMIPPTPDMKRLCDRASKIVHQNSHIRISNLLELDQEGVFKKILSSSVLHDLLVGIFQKGYHCTTFSSNNLRKGCEIGERRWHCDYPYHDMTAPYPSETLGVQVIWALDDFTKANGATEFVYGSHESRSWPTGIESEDVAVATVAKGTMILFLGKLWHAQGVNTTDSDRAALLANFSPLHVLVKDDSVNGL